MYWRCHNYTHPDMSGSIHLHTRIPFHTYRFVYEHRSGWMVAIPKYHATNIMELRNDIKIMNYLREHKLIDV